MEEEDRRHSPIRSLEILRGKGQGIRNGGLWYNITYIQTLPSYGSKTQDINHQKPTFKFPIPATNARPLQSKEERERIRLRVK